MEDMNSMHNFNVVIVGIIFDPAKKKILIGRREDDPNLPSLKWCFPGGRLDHGEDLDEKLKKRLKNQTGYHVKNLGSVFTKTHPEKENLVAIYFLCEAYKGEEKAGDNVIELKWVSPEEVEDHFETELPTRLKEYIMSLR